MVAVTDNLHRHGSAAQRCSALRQRPTISSDGLRNNIPDDTTDYIWSGWPVVEERNSSNAPMRQYVWGTYIDECIQLTTLVVLGPQSLPAGTYYLLQDLLYRAVALTNSSGAIVEAYDTDAYGNTLIFTGPGADGIWFTDDDVQSSYGANEIIYCGYRYDPETGLYYVRNRTYSPILGRWLQRDPIGYRGGINLYGYVMGNSVGSTDPNGQQGQGSSQYIWHGAGTAAPPNSTLPCNDCPPGQQSTTYWQANGYQSTNACIGDVGLSALIGWGVGAVGQGTGSGGNVGGVIGWAIWAMLRWIEYTAWITCISQVCH